MHLSSNFSIQVNDISKSYQGKIVLDKLDFTINSDERVACIGSNGAGKSTLLEIISGLKSYDSGKIQFIRNGISTNLPAKWIGYASQSAILWNKLTVEEHFELIARFYEIEKSDLQFRKNVIWNLFQMKEYKNTLISKLSGGWKQRVNLALSLLHNPKILIWDEPTTGLDIETKIILRTVLSNFKKENPAIIIISSHDLSELQNSSEKFLILKKGKIIIYGHWKQLKEFYNRYCFNPNENPSLEDIYQVAMSLPE